MDVAICHEMSSEHKISGVFAVLLSIDFFLTRDLFSKQTLIMANILILSVHVV